MDPSAAPPTGGPVLFGSSGSAKEVLEALQALARAHPAIVPPYARAEAAQETVIGIDSRYRIYPAASGHPERAIGLLTFSGGSCTGWLINQNTVATAGHCVHQGNGGSFRTNVVFFPGRDGPSVPFGSCTARTLFTVVGWATNGDEQFDYGAVKLNCTVGNTTGWFGFFWQAASLVGLPVQVSGYPGDKPFGTHWSGSGDVQVSEVRKTRYMIDTFNGQSGGPASGPSAEVLVPTPYTPMVWLTVGIAAHALLRPCSIT